MHITWWDLFQEVEIGSKLRSLLTSQQIYMRIVTKGDEVR